MSAAILNKSGDFLDTFEEKYLQGKRRQKIIARLYKGRPGILDMGSAANMHIFEEVIKYRPSMLEKSRELISFYPAPANEIGPLEAAVVSMFRRQTGIILSSRNIALFNGIYSSYRSILLSNPRKTVIVPEFIHHIHKACFASLERKVVEAPMDNKNLLDVPKLEKILKKTARRAGFLYINHNRGPRISKEYLNKIGDLLCKHDVRAIYDADTVFTAHIPGLRPWMPLQVPAFAKRSIFLGNLTKEFGAPGLRIGYGIGPVEMIQPLRHFQKMNLEMIPPLNSHIAEHILRHGNMRRAIRILKERMRSIISGLSDLRWTIESPAMGVNLFFRVPPTFEQTKKFNSDEVFCYYLIEKTGILLRPASTYGSRVTNEIRLVTSQPQKIIQEMFRRMQKSGIRFDMEFPKNLEKKYAYALKKS